MANKRKSCPVFKREIIELKDFDKNNSFTYDGTETVRKLNKFNIRWFKANAVAIIHSSKSFYGRTFVIPYKDIGGVRYWIVDPERKKMNEKIKILYGENL